MHVIMVAQNHWGVYIYEKAHLITHLNQNSILLAQSEKAWQIERKPLVHIKIQARPFVVRMSP